MPWNVGTALGLSLLWFIPGNPGCSYSSCGAEGWEFPGLFPSSQGSPVAPGAALRTFPSSWDVFPVCTFQVRSSHLWGHLGRFPAGCTAGIVSEGHRAGPVDPEGLPTLRSVFISVFSPLKPLVTGLCCMDTGNVCGPSFPHFPEGQARCCRRVWSLGVSTDAGFVFVQQLQLIPVAWECRGEQEQPPGHPSWEKGAGSAWWESQPSLGLPSHHIFFFFFLLLLSFFCSS